MMNKGLVQKNMSLVGTQKRFMGGAKPPPNMPSTTVDFDLVVVGKYICFGYHRRLNCIFYY